MPSNKDKLDQRLKQATLDFEAFAGVLSASRNNTLINNDLGEIFSALDKSLSSQLEVLKLLAGDS
jgi:Ca2+-binding EF-hand superfamily protein